MIFQFLFVRILQHKSQQLRHLPQVFIAIIVINHQRSQVSIQAQLLHLSDIPISCIKRHRNRQMPDPVR
ncbi:hypothetical protein [Nostoc sp. PA-18-2419]|uniref:hypothetical protein n=1 Tax=Nostoc sp. PA-18-2419 TaxID=2575443 RepID=UPI001672442B|nr:hypothetical protein [Nostoc sp. PA-18-2419]